jgi:hypothetical protein
MYYDKILKGLDVIIHHRPFSIYFLHKQDLSKRYWVRHLAGGSTRAFALAILTETLLHRLLFIYRSSIASRDLVFLFIYHDLFTSITLESSCNDVSPVNTFSIPSCCIERMPWGLAARSISFSLGLFRIT